jgi:hypothetical protein
MPFSASCLRGVSDAFAACGGARSWSIKLLNQGRTTNEGRTTMKLTTIALASAFALSNTFALAYTHLIGQAPGPTTVRSV